MDIDEAIIRLNYAAEAAHRKHLTFGYGHMAMYMEKAEEAADYVAANYPKNMGGYPLIEVEAKSMKKSQKDVADAIIRKRSIWIKSTTKIEKIRFSAKYKLENKKGVMETVLEKAIKDLDKI